MKSSKKSYNIMDMNLKHIEKGRKREENKGKTRKIHKNCI